MVRRAVNEKTELPSGFGWNPYKVAPIWSALAVMSFNDAVKKV